MISKIVATGLGIVLMGLVTLAGVDSCRKKQGQGSQIIAAEAKGEANAHQTQAQASDKAVADLQAKLEAAKADLGRLSAERSALLRKLAAAKQDGGDQGVPSAGSAAASPAAVSVDLSAQVIAKDAEVIAAQDSRIQGLEEANRLLTASRDEWKATAEARERQALAQEAATKAWKQAVTTSKWRGRVEGFAAGVALGYVARGQR